MVGDFGRFGAMPSARALMLRTEPSFTVSALRVSIAIAVLCLAGCDKPTAPNNTDSADGNFVTSAPPPQRATPAEPKTPPVLYWENVPSNDPRMMVMRDAESGCQYIVIADYGIPTASAVVPRLDARGKPMCGHAQEKAR